MHPDAEHQEDHADFRQLVGQVLVRHVARREGPHEDAREEIADERRDADAVGDCPERECQNETDHNG